MIEQIFYATGSLFFSLGSFVIIKCYLTWKRLYNKMEPTISLPEQAEETSVHDANYQKRLVKARVKTEEDLAKMSENEVKKLYLKHEQSIIDNVAGNVSKVFAKLWTKSVSRVVSVDEVELEAELNKDVFVEAFLKEYFPPFYYDYGMYLAPFSVLLTTANHIDYKWVGNSLEINDNGQEEPQEDDADADSSRTSE